MIKVISVTLFCLFGGALSQFETIFKRPNNQGLFYESAGQEIVNNYLNNKPLLNYVPVYNTEYGQWDGENKNLQKVEPIKRHRITYQLPKPDVDFQKLSEIIIRLKADMQMLSHQTKNAYDDKLKELNEVKKLNDDLRVALQNADVLKNSLNEHEKQLNELTKNIQDRSDYSAVNQSGIEEFLKMIESLELMVRNISYQYREKPTV